MRDRTMTPAIHTRVKGRGALVKRLGGLLIAVHRYGRCRAATADERRWAAVLIDQLNAALLVARGEVFTGGSQQVIAANDLPTQADQQDGRA